MRRVRAWVVVFLLYAAFLPRGEGALRAGISLDDAIRTADDIVVVRVGETIEVVETLAGTIKPGEHMEIPTIVGMTREEYETRKKQITERDTLRGLTVDFDAAVPKREASDSHGATNQYLKLVNGTTAVLFLNRARENEKDTHQDQFLLLTGDGHRFIERPQSESSFEFSVRWVCEGKVYGLGSRMIPGPLEPMPETDSLGGRGPAVTWEYFKEKIARIIGHRHEYEVAMEIADPRGRLRALKPLLDPEPDPSHAYLASQRTADCVSRLIQNAAAQGGDKAVGEVLASLVDTGDLSPCPLAIQVIGHAGPATIPALLRMYEMPSYDVYRSFVYTALGDADRKTFRLDYAALLDKERAFWQAEAPRLTEAGWLFPPHYEGPRVANSRPLSWRHSALIALLQVVSDNVTNAWRMDGESRLLETSHSARVDNAGAAKLYAPADLGSLRKTATEILAMPRAADALDTKTKGIAEALARMYDVWKTIPAPTPSPSTGQAQPTPGEICKATEDTVNAAQTEPALQPNFIIARVYDSLEAIPESYRLALGIRVRDDGLQRPAGFSGSLSFPFYRMVSNYWQQVEANMDRKAAARIEGLPESIFLVGDPEDQINPEMATLLREQHCVWREVRAGTYLAQGGEVSQAAPRFIDALVKPIAGATVTARWKKVSTATPPSASPLAEVGPWTTDAEGIAGIVFPDETSFKMVELMVSHPDYGTAVLKEGFGETLATVLVHKEAPEAKLASKGRVIGPDGKPVAKARLKLNPAMEWAEYAELWIVTDADGRFRAFPLVPEKYLVSHNFERPTIESTAFGYRVFAPEGRDFASMTGRVSSQSEAVIAMEKGYFHTFTFVDNDGPIGRDRLEPLFVRMDPEQFEPERAVFRSGEGVIHPGTYMAQLADQKFDPVVVTPDSPEELVFSMPKQGLTILGQVVDAITGKPLANAIITDATGGKPAPYLGSKEWDLLDAMPGNAPPDHPAMAALRSNYSVQELVARPDVTGHFSLTYKQGKAETYFTVVARDYLEFRDGPKQEDYKGGIADRGVIRMIPAATVSVKLPPTM
ncbi:MAG: carboxypeptidase-like regulatory domain-containing protein, partial [Candidatus Hydrogenedentales bacterium]